MQLPHKKPLYLHGGLPVRILRDGPTLRVRVKGDADRLFPLQRISRIMVLGAVEWATDALLACADARIPVNFLSGHGEPRAVLRCPGTAETLVEFDRLIDRLLEDSSGVEGYRLWQKSESWKARQRVVSEASRGHCSMDSAVLRRLFEKRASYCARAVEYRRFRRQLHGLLAINVEHLLGEAGIDINASPLQAAGIGLAQDWVGILEWRLQNPALTFIKRQHRCSVRKGETLARLGWKEAVCFFEAQTSETDKAFRALLRRFHTYLLDLVKDNGCE